MKEIKDDVQDRDEEEARVYELSFHIVPHVGDEGLGAEVDLVHACVSKNKGSIISEERPQLMRLSYPLERVISRKHQKFESAYFGWMVFEAYPSDAHAIKEAMRANEHVIRFFMVKTEKDAPIVRHPAQAPRNEPKTPDVTPRAEKPAADAVVSETPAEPMSTEQLDAEIEKLVV